VTLMRTVRLSVAYVPNRDVLLADLLKAVARHPGNDVLEIAIETPYGIRTVRAARTVDSWDPGLWSEVETLLGVEDF